MDPGNTEPTVKILEFSHLIDCKVYIFCCGGHQCRQKGGGTGSAVNLLHVGDFFSRRCIVVDDAAAAVDLQIYESGIQFCPLQIDNLRLEGICTSCRKDPDYFPVLDYQI